MPSDLRIFTREYPSGTVWDMPALNVEFSERELEDLRQIAKERGTSMKALVREAAAADIARHRALQEGAEAFRRFFAGHAEEFAAAFPDDERPARGEAA
ncbi:hypothetical protein GCM10017687_37030 [Streptomyces echinatus]